MKKRILLLFAFIMLLCMLWNQVVSYITVNEISNMYLNLNYMNAGNNVDFTVSMDTYRNLINTLYFDIFLTIIVLVSTVLVFFARSQGSILKRMFEINSIYLGLILTAVAFTVFGVISAIPASDDIHFSIPLTAFIITLIGINAFFLLRFLRIEKN